MDSLISKRSFIGLDNNTWLYSAAEAPTHRGLLDVMTEYLTARSCGPGGRDRNSEVEQACKANVARLLNGATENIALVSNSSEAISGITQSLEPKRGDNVVINTLEFPSGVLPWLAERRSGVEVRVVPHRGWEVSIDDILAQVDTNTRLVVTSHVSYLSGSRIDYKSLYHSLRSTRSLLLLDATQSLGVVPVDMNYTDFVVSSSYKWLLSTHGAGILGVNPDRTRDIIPRSTGWRSVSDMFSPSRFERYTLYEDARRFELGYPSYPTVYCMKFTTDVLLEVGIERIEQHVLQLGGYLIEELQRLGYEVMTPTPAERRAGNIAVVCSDGDKVAEELRKQRIFVWGGDGRLRASVHLFNDGTDVERFVIGLRTAGATADTLAE